ncbi:MAG: outer membrane beta-barrel protein, partial [Pacificimonas sp.]
MTRIFLIPALLATTAVATSALARDGSPYVGVEGGFFRAGDAKFEDPDSERDAVRVQHSTGFEAGGVIGYDFGMFRVELEGSYKQADATGVELDDLGFDTPGGIDLGDDTRLAPGFFNDGRFTNADGETEIITGMANLLFDLGGEDGIGVSIGGGAGVARFSAEDYALEEDGFAFAGGDATEFAYQGIAQLRVPVAPSLDLGVKYR